MADEASRSKSVEEDRPPGKDGSEKHYINHQISTKHKQEKSPSFLNVQDTCEYAESTHTLVLEELEHS